MHERRQAVRTQVDKPATVCPCESVQLGECVVRNITPLGACVENTSGVPLGDRFLLSFDRFRTERACRVVWRRENLIGVAFQS